MVNVGGRARGYGQLQTTRNKRKRGSLSQSFVFYHHRQSIRCLVNLCFTAFNYIDLIDLCQRRLHLTNKIPRTLIMSLI